MQTALRRIRKSKGVSQTWLAEALGIHRTTYVHYETGRYQPPKSVLFHAAHLLGVSPESLTDAVH